MWLCSKTTQWPCEAPTYPAVLSQALYHCAPTALIIFFWTTCPVRKGPVLRSWDQDPTVASISFKIVLRLFLGNKSSITSCPPEPEFISFFFFWKHWPEVINLFSCSTHMSMNFNHSYKLTKIPTNEEVYCFKSLRCCIYHANKC